MKAMRTKAKKPKLSAKERAKRRGGIYGHFDQHYFLSGRKGDLVFFIRNNKQCVRPLGDMTTERWWKDDRFANSRGASREFGAACAYSGAIRKGLGKLANEVGGTKLLHNKVVKQVLHSFKGLPGRRGERVLSGGHVAARLTRLAWNKNGQTHLMPFGFSQAVIEPMIWKPKVEFRFVEGFKVPSWASEVRVVFTVVAVGDMVRRKNGRKYCVSRGHRALHSLSRSTSSEWHSVSEFGFGKLTTGKTRLIRLRQDIATEPLAPSLNLAAGHSVRPDLVFPEAVALGMGLVVVTAVEVRGLQPNGEVFDQQFLGMECAWAGNVASSMLEMRESEEREAKAREVVEWLRMQEPLLLYCEENAPIEVHERVARDRLRRLEAIRMVEEALNSG